MNYLDRYPKEFCRRHFDFVAQNYEEIYKRAGYPDPEMVSKVAKEISSAKGKDISKINVIDFACGTGLVGEALNKDGFKNITGIDIS